MVYLCLSVHLRYCGDRFTDFSEETKSLITCMSILPMSDVAVDCRNSIMQAKIFFYWNGKKNKLKENDNKTNILEKEEG